MAEFFSPSATSTHNQEFIGTINSSVSAWNSNHSVSSGIHVAVRIRPLSQHEISSGRHSCCQTIGDSTVIISKEGDNSAYLKSQVSSIHEYAFDAVFDGSSTQEEVYNKTAKPYIHKAIMGENVTIFAYGTTGAGKTHTMFGSARLDSSSNSSGAGIIPHTVRDLFKLINSASEASVGNTASTMEPMEAYTVLFSYLEVYNEQVCDLLESTGKDLPLREDPSKGMVYVVGLSEHPVSSYDEVMDLLMRGQANRKTEATRANAVSSRSHAVLQFSIMHTKISSAGHKTLIEAKLSLIDLAGSERASVTQSTGMRLQEGSNINKSLLALGNCISALSERANDEKSSGLRSPTPTFKKTPRKSVNVKYRDSKLTHLLKGSLDGNCNLVMIANVNPADDTYDDSYHTLVYANRAKNLKVNPLIKEQYEDITAEKQLRLIEENNALRCKVIELEATVQRLLEHHGRSSIDSSSMASRRSTIDSDMLQCTTTTTTNGTGSHHHQRKIMLDTNTSLDVIAPFKKAKPLRPKLRKSLYKQMDTSSSSSSSSQRREKEMDDLALTGKTVISCSNNSHGALILNGDVKSSSKRHFESIDDLMNDENAPPSNSSSRSTNLHSGIPTDKRVATHQSSPIQFGSPLGKFVYPADEPLDEEQQLVVNDDRRLSSDVAATGAGRRASRVDSIDGFALIHSHNDQDNNNYGNPNSDDNRRSKGSTIDGFALLANEKLSSSSYGRLSHESRQSCMSDMTYGDVESRDGHGYAVGDGSHQLTKKKKTKLFRRILNGIHRIRKRLSGNHRRRQVVT